MKHAACGGEWCASSQVKSIILTFHSLSDGTFLAYQKYGTVLIRFYADLATPFIHPNIVILDNKIIDDVFYKI